MIEEIRTKLEDEVAELVHELNVTLPHEIEKAVAQGDLRENSEYSAALERQGFVRSRIDYLSRRLSQLGEIDVQNLPEDRVGFGSHVKVKDIDSGDVETFSLTLGDNLDLDSEEISLESPIGRALLGKQEGDVVTVSLPRGSRDYEVIEVKTVHDLA